MNCREARNRLMEGKGREGAFATEEHLESCSSCQHFAARLKATHQALKENHSQVEPDPAFAARVLAQLPVREPAATSELLGWAALRLLPVTLAFLLALSAWSLSSSPSPTVLFDEESSQSELSWVLDQEAFANGEPKS